MELIVSFLFLVQSCALVMPDPNSALCSDRALSFPGRRHHEDNAPRKMHDQSIFGKVRLLCLDYSQWLG